MAMNDATKRKEPEPESKVAEPVAEVDGKTSPEAAKIVVAVKPEEGASQEPEAKRLKATPPDSTAVRKQIEYYLSDDNLKFDKFFHEKIAADAEGWLEIGLVMSCRKIQNMRASKEDVLTALKTSAIEVKEDSSFIRRPGNLPLPKLESRPMHQKKNGAHAHDGGVIAVFKAVPAEQSWKQVKEKLREKLPAKVQLWYVGEVTDKNTCTIASAPFENDLQFFEDLELEVGGAKIKAEVVHGDTLQQCAKLLPKNIKEKRDKEARKRQKERNRPIVVGQQRFVNVSALRTRVKEILNSRSDGESLKAEGSDFKLIKALLGFHPKGAEKSQGLTGIKVAKSPHGDSRCFFMVKEDSKEEDFSAQKCLAAIEANPPYVEVASKETKKEEEPKPAGVPASNEAKPAEKQVDADTEVKQVKKEEDPKPAEVPAADEAKAAEKQEEAQKEAK
jgi:hypothetical protein